jgi:hypothetical protein
VVAGSRGGAQRDFGFEGNGATRQRGSAGRDVTRLVQREVEGWQRKRERERAQ